MRTRTRPLPLTSTVGTLTTYNVASNGFNGGLPYGTNTFTSAGFSISAGLASVIEDEIPEYDRYGNCKHTTTSLVFRSTPKADHVRRITSTTTKEWARWDNWYHANRAYRTSAVLAKIVSPVVNLDNWERMSARALKSMVPSFNDGNSAVNFVLELKDLKRIPDLWKKKNKLLGKPPLSWSKRPKSGDILLPNMRARLKHLKAQFRVLQKAGFKSLTDLTRNGLSEAAVVQLTWAFGVLPFMLDVQGMFDSLTAMRKKLQKLRELNGKPVTRHFRTSLPVPSLPSVFIHNEGAVWTDVGTSRVTQPYRVTVSHTWEEYPMYSATARFTYSLPDMSSIDNQMKAFLDALGVRPDPSIVWNATRFSFLVDWVVNVGDWLGSLSVDNLEIPVVVEDFCHSVKYSAKCNVDVLDYYTSMENVIARSTTYYERKRAIPYSLNTIENSGISSREARLGAALTVANWKPRWSKKAGRWFRS